MTIVDGESTTPDALKVVVSIDRAADARDVAAVLAALDRAFSLFARERTGVSGIRLRIVRTGVGSWWAYLTAAKKLYDLAKDHPELVSCT